MELAISLEQWTWLSVTKLQACLCSWNSSANPKKKKKTESFNQMCIGIQTKSLHENEWLSRTLWGSSFLVPSSHVFFLFNTSTSWTFVSLWLYYINKFHHSKFFARMIILCPHTTSLNTQKREINDKFAQITTLTKSFQPIFVYPHFEIIHLILWMDFHNKCLYSCKTLHLKCVRTHNVNF